ncbi:MAG: UTP--glucose-1-phosphate uridylyltransferase [Planctomycetes bacterium]|nr:UTP--glucose-1-phosphate uridylyltransferase [Planctomycetota bacterium]
MICSAVVPVAGIGTRLLPLTKSQPKELLPVGRKPVIQHVVEELKSAGLRNVVFVTAKRKTAIENHFDRDPELIHSLEGNGKSGLVPLIDFDDLGLELFYTRQQRQKGLGHAVGFAEAFAAGRPFVLALGDTIIRSAQPPSVITRLMNCFERKNASCVVALQEVPKKDVVRYGIAKPVAGENDDVFELADLIEKPSVESAPSNLAIAARYVFSADIFDAIARTQPGAGGEIQLTDAIRLLLKEGGKVYGVRMSPADQRYDIGTFESYFKCFADYALADDECGERLRKYLKQKL